MNSPNPAERVSQRVDATLFAAQAGLLLAALLSPTLFSPAWTTGLAFGVLAESVVVFMIVILYLRLGVEGPGGRTTAAIVFAATIVMAFLMMGPTLAIIPALPPLLMIFRDVFRFATANGEVRPQLQRVYAVIVLRAAIVVMTLVGIAVRAMFFDRLWINQTVHLHCETFACLMLSPPDFMLAYGAVYYALTAVVTWAWKPSWMRQVPVY